MMIKMMIQMMLLVMTVMVIMISHRPDVHISNIMIMLNGVLMMTMTLGNLIITIRIIIKDIQDSVY